MRRSEFMHGLKAVLPILLGVLPFGLIYGALAMAAGLSVAAAQSMSLIVLAGSSQFVMVKLLAKETPALVVIITSIIVNVRHMLYSLSIAPHLKHLPPAWKWLLAYVLTDEAYAMGIVRYQQGGDSPFKHWYFLGAATGLVVSWVVSTALGIALGAQMPAAWSLDFAIPLTFIALVVPMLRDRAGVVAALAASVAAVLIVGVPHRLELLLATFIGIAAGVAIDTATAATARAAARGGASPGSEEG